MQESVILCVRLRIWKVVKIAYLLFFTHTTMLDEFLRLRKFAKLVADHVFSHIDGGKVLAVVDKECVTYEVRCDHRTTRPSLDRPFLTGFVHLVDFDQKFLIDKWPFFE